MTLPAKLPTQLFHSGHFWNVLQHIAPFGVTIDHVSDPNYWQHVQSLLKRRDVIEVLADDNSFEARFRVLDPTKGNLKLRLIGTVGDPLLDEPSPVPMVSDLAVNFAPAQKWRVIDEKTKEVVAKDYATKAEAEQARDNLLAARKAA